MKIYPQLDIYDGKCVWLEEDGYARPEVFYENPVDAAKMWEQKGASALHIVDLNGFLNGKRGNSSIAEKVAGSVTIPVQIGGGLRSIADIAEALNTGAARAVIGTGAILDEELLEEGIRRFRDRLAVSIAAKGGYVAIKGWVNMSEFSAYNFASKLVNKGCRSIIYKDISGDGIPKGLSCNGIEKLCNVEGARITASGGVASLEDLKAVKAAGAEGVIIGKALYAGAIKLEDALRAAGE